MNILITGGTGYIGRELCRALAQRNDNIWVYSRRPAAVQQLCGPRANPVDSLDKITALNLDAVVNLAGESIAGGLWTTKRKQKLRDSRIQLTADLCSNLARSDTPPMTFISASATGVYGDGGDTFFSEDSPASSNDFAQQLCHDWETAADPASEWSRVVKLRIGLVMGPGGGFLGPLKLPFRLGLGGRLGSGQQWMSWISLADMVNVILFCLDNSTCKGPVNAVAPNPVTNREFTQTFAELLNRPAIIPAPATALKIGLGELSSLLLGGQRVIPEKLQALGFEFKHAELESALRAAL